MGEQDGFLFALRSGRSLAQGSPDRQAIGDQDAEGPGGRVNPEQVSDRYEERIEIRLVPPSMVTDLRKRFLDQLKGLAEEVFGLALFGELILIIFIRGVIVIDCSGVPGLGSMKDADEQRSE